MPVTADARVVNVETTTVRIITVRGFGLQPKQNFSAVLFGIQNQQIVRSFANPDGTFLVRFVIGEASIPNKIDGYISAGTTHFRFGAGGLT